MLRILIASGAIVGAGVAGAQVMPASGPVSRPPAGLADAASSATTAPVDGADAARDPLTVMRAAMNQAQALSQRAAFQAGLHQQRANAATVGTPSLVSPRFDLHAPQPPEPAASADALAPPPRQWAIDNRQPLLILVSFSMPDSELQELAAQGARIGAPLVLRGLFDDSFPETQRRLMRFRSIRGASFRIDPTVFRRFDVDQVPTFVLPLEALQTCSTANCPVPAHVSVTGDAGLDYVLDEIDRRSDDARARSLAQALRTRLSAEPAP